MITLTLTFRFNQAVVMSAQRVVENRHYEPCEAVLYEDVMALNFAQYCGIVFG